MEIGFVSFDQAALSRARKVMALLQGKGAIDELGLGRIRDAFSNMMFPGLSTLQTHAKYFLVMPALYAHLEKTPIADVRDARAKVRRYEINITERLRNGSPSGTPGIIGAETLHSRSEYVKYDPAYIYHVGMQTYGMIPQGENIYALLAERSAFYQNSPKSQSGTDDTGDDSGDLTGARTLFISCGEHYDFGSDAPMPIRLSAVEAEFLRKKIIAHTSGSLLAYLLESGLYAQVVDSDFEDLYEPFSKSLPDELFRTYLMARRFSRFALLLRVRFAMLYDRAVGAGDAADGEEAFFESLLKKHSAEFSPEAIGEVIEFIMPIVDENSCKSFVLKSSEYIERGDLGGLDSWIKLREETIKGPRRSKLANPQQLAQGKAFDSPAAMTFRWSTIVRTLLSEILHHG